MADTTPKTTTKLNLKGILVTAVSVSLGLLIFHVVKTQVLTRMGA
jgi:hypothetical protein